MRHMRRSLGLIVAAIATANHELALRATAQPPPPPPGDGSDGGSMGGNMGPTSESPTTQPPAGASSSWMDPTSSVPPDPTPSLGSGGSGFVGSRGIDFGSDSSGVVVGSWTPWPSAGSSSHGFDGSGIDWNKLNDTTTVTIQPGIDGSLPMGLRRRELQRFDHRQGFVVAGQGNDSRIQPGHCPHAFCIHVSFESEYGALSDFDAFVMDRLETSTPLESEEFHNGGPMPMVLGSVRESQLTFLGMNYSAGRNWVDARRTTWTLFSPDPNVTELDMTLSLKQLYTLLPGYEAAEPVRMGPYYSADITDQVIIRLAAGVVSPYAGVTSLLPIVVNYTGSQLFDVDSMAQLLHPEFGINGTNELAVTLKLSRRRYGAFMPWSQARPSIECDVCGASLPDAFPKCLETKMPRSDQQIFDDLLSTDSNHRAVDIEPAARDCFVEMARGDWDNFVKNDSNSANGPTMNLNMNMTGGGSGDPMGPEPSGLRGWELVKATDRALRCLTRSRCPIGGSGVKSDGLVVVLNHQRSRTVMNFSDPNYSFYLEVGLDDETHGQFTTVVFSSTTPAEQIAQSIATTVPNGQNLNLEIEVRRANNSDEIQWINQENARRLDEYQRALQWSASTAPVSSGSNTGGSNTGGSNTGGLNTGGSNMLPPSDGSSVPPPPSDGSSLPPSGGDGNSESPLMPPPPGRRRRRLADEPITSTTSTGPQPPELLPVPPPRYTVEILSNNVTVTAHILHVFSSENVQYEIHDNVLNFTVAPLELDKYAYVPPPASVDLDYKDQNGTIGGGGWNNGTNNNASTNIWDYVPNLPWNDSCSQCTYNFYECLGDVDCAYGVRTYMAGTLHYWNLVGVNATREPVDPKVGRYGFDLTELLRSARPFFPNQGYSKFSRVLLCLSGRWDPCNVDITRTILNTATGQMVPAPPTTLRFTPARLNVTVQLGDGIAVYRDGAVNQYTFDGNRESLNSFIQNSVLAGAINIGMGMEEEFNPDPSGPRRYSFRFYDGFMEFPTIATFGSTPSVSIEPWRLAVETLREDGGIDGNVGGGTFDGAVIHWRRLDAWLDRFYYYIPPVPINTGNGNNGNGTSSTPAAPSAICGVCNDALMACLGDYTCRMPMQTWLPTLLNPQDWSWSAENLDWDGIYRFPWSTKYNDLLSKFPATVEPKAKGLFECISANRCAVGYLQVNATSPALPTTLGLMQNKTVFTPSSIAVTYRTIVNSLADPFAVQQFVNTVQILYNEVITLSTSWDPVRMGNVYTFRATSDVLDRLTADGTPFGGSNSPPAYNVWFESPSPAKPTWNDLLMWFNTTDGTSKGDGSGSTSTTTPPGTAAGDVCNQCLPKLQECYNNANCWQSAQDVIVPFLRSGSMPISQSSLDGWFTVIQRGLLGNMLYVNTFINHLAFTEPGSWGIFSEFLQCLERTQCDIEYMNGATEAPATAHIPTTVNITYASVTLLTYTDTQVNVMCGDQSTWYTEPGSGSSAPLSNSISSVCMGKVPFSITVEPDPEVPNFFIYTITFDKYLGLLPEFSVTPLANVPGPRPPAAWVTRWEVALVSINQMPDAQKFLDLLSVAPPGVSSTNPATVVCADCNGALAECYGDFSCQYALTAAVIPALNGMWGNVNNGGVFEYDMTGIFSQQLLPMAGSPGSQQRLMNVFKCAVQFDCATRSGKVNNPFDTTMIQLESGWSQVLKPRFAPLYVEFEGQTRPFDDPNGEGSGGNFAGLLQGAFLDWYGATAAVYGGLNADNYVAFNVRFDNLYRIPAPHFYYDNGGQRLDGTETTWRLVFRSTSYYLHNSFIPLIDWLATPRSS